MKSLKLVLIVSVFFLISCSQRISPFILADTSWVLSEWPNQEMPDQALATLKFNTNTELSGKSFCNGFGGSYVINGSKISFGSLFGTQMYCDAVGDKETKFLEALRTVNKVNKAGDKLQLLRDNTVIMVFSKYPWGF